MRHSSPAADDHPIDPVIRLISALRGDGGCPWDKKQTPKTMARYLLEEAYELAEAVEAETPANACEELGDVLFHILFITCLFQEAGDFTLGDVSAALTRKMTRRHPHVFGNQSVSSADEVRANWQKIKKAEKGLSGSGSALDSIPGNMPALLRAYLILKRTSSSSDVKDDALSIAIHSVDALWKQVTTHASQASDPAGQSNAERHFGELLFALVRFGAAAGIHPETALRRAIEDFERRFREMEKKK